MAKTQSKAPRSAKKAAAQPLDMDKLSHLDEEIVPQTIKNLGFWAGLLLFFAMQWISPPEGLSQQGWVISAMTLTMILWWMTEALPVAITAFLPLLVIPLMGIDDLSAAADGYTNKAIFLTLGGFILGIALQRWNLHKRIALNTVKIIGTSPKQVVAGIMLATCIISMWMTNTATTVMMLPIAFSIVQLIFSQQGGSPQAMRNFGIAMMLGVAYAASIGGMMTLVGTSTNVMFKGFFEQTYNYSINFMDWMKIGVPVGLLLLAAAWYLMVYLLWPAKIEKSSGIDAIISNELRALGRMSKPEKRMALVFLFTVALWMFGEPLATSFPEVTLNDASVAILGASLLFIIPSGGKKGEKLLTWNDAKSLPWDTLILLAGGITMADYMASTGVADWLGGKIAQLDGLDIVLLVLIITTAIIFMTECMSNVACLTAFLPMVVAVSAGLGENPLTLAIPAALVASCAFMFPVATPPNAIVFGTGMLRMNDMVKTGLWLNLIAIVLINALCYFLLPIVFGVEHGVMPEWAVKTSS